MPTPEGSTLIVSDGLSSVTMVVTDVSYVTTFTPFDRLEYDNNKLRDARSAKGERRIIIEMLGGRPAQIITDCASTTPVPLIPDPNSVFDQVARRFNIVRYTINGAVSEASAVNYLYSIAQNHQALLAKFEKYLKRSSGDTSYEDLYALRSETFSYLTTTGVSALGTCIESTVNNILITNISVDNAFAIPNSLGGEDFYKTYQLTFETRTISALGA